MRVAMTLEHLWHDVPGGTATSVLGLAEGLEDRGRLIVLARLVEAVCEVEAGCPVLGPSRGSLLEGLQSLSAIGHLVHFCS